MSRIADLYSEKILADKVADEIGQQRRTMQAFVADRLTVVYGLEELVTAHTKAFRVALERSHHIKAMYMRRFCGYSDAAGALSEQHLAFFLHVLQQVVQGHEKIRQAMESSEYLLSCRIVFDVLRDLFPKSTPSTRQRLIKVVQARAIPDELATMHPTSSDVINLDHLLGYLLEEWDRERSYIKEAVFEASQDLQAHSGCRYLQRSDFPIVLRRLGLRMGMPTNFASSASVLKSLARLKTPCPVDEFAEVLDSQSLFGVTLTLGDRGQVGLSRLEEVWRGLEAAAMNVLAKDNFNFSGGDQTPSILTLTAEIDDLRRLLKTRAASEEGRAWALYYRIEAAVGIH